jgi:hypothetical protein
MLAREYCRRGQYFCNLYYQNTIGDFEYTQAHVDGYRESNEFSAWADALPAVGVLRLRVLEMRDTLVPILGPVVGMEDDGDDEDAIV